MHKEMNSFGVEQKLNQARELTKTFKVMSTPAVIINKYSMDTRMSDNSELTKNIATMVDFLVCKK